MNMLMMSQYYTMLSNIKKIIQVDQPIRLQYSNQIKLYGNGLYNIYSFIRVAFVIIQGNMLVLK
jgi:hypothetical protein